MDVCTQNNYSWDLKYAYKCFSCMQILLSTIIIAISETLLFCKCQDLVSVCDTRLILQEPCYSRTGGMGVITVPHPKILSSF